MKTFTTQTVAWSSVVGLLLVAANPGEAASKSSSKRPDKSQRRASSSASKTNSSPAPAVKGTQGFDPASFKIIADRNVFNANRSGSRPRGDERRPARVESFALTGTLAYEKGSFAFFDGSSRDYQKVLQPQGKIAGYTITEIGHNAAKLAADEQTVEMRIGMQMRREDEGEWKLSAVPAPPASSSSSSSSSRFGSSSSSNSRFSGGYDPNSRFGGDRGSSSRFPGSPDSSRFSSSRSPGSAPSGSPGSGSSSSGPSGVSKEEALRRLMEQRARERQ